ncbi:HAD family hydrolase [Sulfurovum sp. ST-21]|uniref:HAD hydrolase family protein n=1 Tax=Sulfurovum indicum TaxID=2779528 RepID=A0A7M1S4G8_9BACT|nr:HAD hydrolase family protein [Sulfurovum indicum]QOR61250.1 HAD hydrolase family protein [Sulfurovum indicum]
MIKIPNFKNVEIKNILFDYNGTLAKNGKVGKKRRSLLQKICKQYNVYVITADTFGSVHEELKDFDLEVVVLTSDNHTKEKEIFLKSLDRERTIALGNGNNDVDMLKSAVISIAILGDEGCAKETLLASDIVCKSIIDAMGLLLYPKRLTATLRR